MTVLRETNVGGTHKPLIKVPSGACKASQHTESTLLLLDKQQLLLLQTPSINTQIETVLVDLTDSQH